MIESYKGRTVTEGQRVFAYRNLHTSQWSLKALDGVDKGRVVGHADHAILANARFTVSEVGRQRVIREGRKNVHAGVVGTVVDVLDALPGHALDALNALQGVRVTYNPYKAGDFTVVHTGGVVTDASVVDLAENGKAYI